MSLQFKKSQGTDRAEAVNQEQFFRLHRYEAIVGVDVDVPEHRQRFEFLGFAQIQFARVVVNRDKAHSQQ